MQGRSSNVDLRKINTSSNTRKQSTYKYRQELQAQEKSAKRGNWPTSDTAGRERAATSTRTRNICGGKSPPGEIQSSEENIRKRNPKPQATTDNQHASRRQWKRRRRRTEETAKKRQQPYTGVNPSAEDDNEPTEAERKPTRNKT